MSKLIEVWDRNANKGILVSPKHVAWVEGHGDGNTTIGLAGGRVIHTAQSVEPLVARLGLEAKHGRS